VSRSTPTVLDQAHQADRRNQLGNRGDARLVVHVEPFSRSVSQSRVTTRILVCHLAIAHNQQLQSRQLWRTFDIALPDGPQFRFHCILPRRFGFRDRARQEARQQDGQSEQPKKRPAHIFHAAAPCFIDAPMLACADGYSYPQK
jgi:hypothetical protein